METIAGVRIPDSALARDVTQFVADVSTRLLFDHSRRVFLWASLQGERRGLLFDPETPGELAGALGRLIADGALRARLAANARRCARALSWEAQEGELVGLYERVLARSSVRRRRPETA